MDFITYINKEDIKGCHFCHIEIGQWNHVYSVRFEHVRWLPRCSMVKVDYTVNLSKGEAALGCEMCEVIIHLRMEKFSSFSVYIDGQKGI